MDFEIAVANCISSDKLQNEDVGRISDLLTARKVSLEDVIGSLEAELVSPIVSQKKRGIEIIEQVLWSYLPNEDFTETHAKLICCFVLNYISDWACVDSVVGIIRCVFSNKDPKSLKEIRIDIRDDETVREEYCFSPVVELARREDAGPAGLGPGRPTKDGKFFRSFVEICSYHKFNKRFGIGDAESDEELYCMSIVFYLVTQVLYRVSTRQLVYSSRLRIIDLLLFVLSTKEFHSELLRLGPGIVPVVMQHIENEKDPRVLMKAFPLVQLMIQNFQEVISLYDACVPRGGGEEREGLGAFQLYVGRLPKVSDEERRRLELKNPPEEGEEASREETSSGDGILSHLVSEVLFSYFPLQFQGSASSSQAPRAGAVSPLDLKLAYFSAITCSCLTQDSLVRALVEYIDTQGLLEDIVSSYEELHFEDEKELDRFLDSRRSGGQLSNRLVHLRQADQDILGESLALLGMVKYEISPAVVNKYISSVFLLVDELLKSTIVATERTYGLLLSLVSAFIRLELGFENGLRIVDTFLSQSVLPKLLLRLDSSQQLDPFALNILQVFLLTESRALAESVKDGFVLVDIAKSNVRERVQMNLKLLTTLCVLAETGVASDSATGRSRLREPGPDAERRTRGDSFDSRVSEFLEDVERETRPGGGLLEDLELPRLGLFLMLKCLQRAQRDELDRLLRALGSHWDSFDRKTEADRSLVAGLTSLLLFTDKSESRAHWRGFLEASWRPGGGRPGPAAAVPGSGRAVLEHLMYTVVREEEVPAEMAAAFIETASRSVLESVSGDPSPETWGLLLKERVSSINDVLGSEKWASIRGLSAQCSQWVGAIIGSLSGIGDRDLILQKKSLFYEVSKGLGVLTYRLLGHLFGPGRRRDGSPETRQEESEFFAEFESRLREEASGHWLVCVYLNELLAHALSGDRLGSSLLDRLEEACSGWLGCGGASLSSLLSSSSGCEKASRLVDLELEKLVVNLVVLRKRGGRRPGGSSASDLLKTASSRGVVRNKTLRHSFFSETDGFEDCCCQVKRLAEEISRDLRGPHALKSPSSDLFSLLYVTGSDLSLLKNPSAREFSVLIGKSRYLLGRSNTDRRELQMNGYHPSTIPFLVVCSTSSSTSTGTGKYLLELAELGRLLSDPAKKQVSRSQSLLVGNHGETRTFHPEESRGSDCGGGGGCSSSSSSVSIEDLWPEVIPLTDNCHHRLDLSCPRVQEKAKRLHQIMVEAFSEAYPINPNPDMDSNPDRSSYPLVLVPIISSMCNLNMKSIINSLSSTSIQLILALGLAECTNYSNYQPERLENPSLLKYIANLAAPKGEGEEREGTWSALDPQGRTEKVKRLLARKGERLRRTPPSAENDDWSKSKLHELQIHNLQVLSLLIRVLHYSRENKLAIYEQRGQTRHSFDFVLDSLGVYSVLASNILENHPNALVRFLCNLVISQIFKFPSVFRTNIKDDVINSLTNASNRDQDKGLRKMSCILKLKILTLNDHIY